MWEGREISDAEKTWKDTQGRQTMWRHTKTDHVETEAEIGVMQV